MWDSKVHNYPGGKGKRDSGTVVCQCLVSENRLNAGYEKQ